MKRGPLIRDDDGAWATAGRGKQALGLVFGGLLSLLVFVPIILIVYFLLIR